MSTQKKLKELRQDLRKRFMGDSKEDVIKEFHRVMKNGDRNIRRLYLSALKPLVIDQANKES